MSKLTAVLWGVSGVLAAALTLLFVATGNTDALEWIAATGLSLGLPFGLSRLQGNTSTRQPRR